jgi:hypothetical protein
MHPGRFDRIENLSAIACSPAWPRPGQAAPSDERGLILRACRGVPGVPRTLGITPESFSRAVTILADMGLIRRLGRGRFQVLEPGSLRRLGYPSGL